MTTNRASVLTHRRHNSRPSVTEEDIIKAEQMIRDAERIVEDAADRHRTKTFDLEQAALWKIQESEEFQTRVKAFRDDLLHKEATLPPQTELGQKLALERIDKQVNGYEAVLRCEMRKKEVEEQANKPPKSPQVYKSSIPFHTFNEPSPTPKTPRRSPPLCVPKLEKIAMTLGDRPQIELSPTGYANFPRLCEDEDWERVSIESTSKEEDGEMATPKKAFFKGWFGRK